MAWPRPVGLAWLWPGSLPGSGCQPAWLWPAKASKLACPPSLPPKIFCKVHRKIEVRVRKRISESRSIRTGSGNVTGMSLETVGRVQNWDGHDSGQPESRNPGLPSAQSQAGNYLACPGWMAKGCLASQGSQPGSTNHPWLVKRFAPRPKVPKGLGPQWWGLGPLARHGPGWGS